MKNKILEIIYTNAVMLARRNKQVVGSKNDYYVTLQQLEALMLQARETEN